MIRKLLSGAMVVGASIIAVPAMAQAKTGKPSPIMRRTTLVTPIIGTIPLATSSHFGTTDPLLVAIRFLTLGMMERVAAEFGLSARSLFLAGQTQLLPCVEGTQMDPR